MYVDIKCNKIHTRGPGVPRRGSHGIPRWFPMGSQNGLPWDPGVGPWGPWGLGAPWAFGTIGTLGLRDILGRGHWPLAIHWPSEPVSLVVHEPRPQNSYLKPNFSQNWIRGGRGGVGRDLFNSGTIFLYKKSDFGMYLKNTYKIAFWVYFGPKSL